MEILIIILIISVMAVVILLVNQSNKTAEFSVRINDLILRQRESEKIINDQLTASRREQSDNIFNLTRTLDNNMKELRKENGVKLEEMRTTVDEKLQSTLESRIGTSFKQVSSQLEKVYEELGKMKTLSEGVGSLQRILTNVKSRGVWGEVQAKRILQDILTPDQYEENVQTKKGSQFRVEFAVKLPGALLPIDSKFPREDYENLQEAQEKGDLENVKNYKIALAKRIKEEARTIREKYINVPVTTDFGILFLPVESLYAEVLSMPGIAENVQKEYHVIISGPTTMASLLNSLQLGFQTLAVERKSTEVWNVLGQVKTEFGNFSQVLESLKIKLDQANRQLDNAFVRTRAIGRKLKEVETAPCTELNAEEKIDKLL